MSSQIYQLLDTLASSEIGMTSYEMADVCWLLMQRGEEAGVRSKEAEGRRQEAEVMGGTQEVGVGEVGDSEGEGIENVGEGKDNFGDGKDVGNDLGEISDDDPKVSSPAGQLTPQVETSSKSPEKKGLTLKVADPPALRKPLPLAKALQELLRKVPTSARQATLDEVRTVELTAANEFGLPIPVFNPAMEPWLDLAVVVDGNVSMDIWQRQIQDFYQLLSNYGIFRDVRLWTLVKHEDDLRLKSQWGVGSLGQVSDQELVDPTGRRMIFLISDCVASYWQDGRLLPLLQRWSRHCPTAIVQMLPEWLWLKSGLRQGAKVLFSSEAVGGGNQRLRVEEILLWEEVFNDRNRLNVPIVTIESAVLQRWSGVVMGRANETVAGFVLSGLLDPDDFNDDVNDDELTAEERVEQFRNNASGLAQELAGLLASVPTILLPVVRLIQTEMLPKSESVHMAEVFLGGILKVWLKPPGDSNPDHVLYDFVDPQVRKILARSTGRSRSLDVYERVSGYIARRLDLSLREFIAELKKPPTEIEDSEGIIQPFAEISAQVLTTLGGEYARFVQEELLGGEFGDTPDAPVASEEWPELQTLEFTVKTITVGMQFPKIGEQSFDILTLEKESDEDDDFKLEPYIFKIATLKRQQRSTNLSFLTNLFQRNRVQIEWVIEERASQARQFIDKTVEGLNLEMVLIPSGEFMMGASEKEAESASSERPPHTVKINDAFLMGKYPITQAQWRIVAGFPQEQRELKQEPSDFKGDNRPAEKINWFDAVEFCARLSKKTGRHYRLPTEAEWEYACRAGTNSPFHFGETITTDVANYRGTDDINYGWKGNYGEGPKGEYRKETTPVDKFSLANAFGLYDMHGNVWEWCEDYWHKNYEEAPNDRSAWLTGNDHYRVVRGGSWDGDPRFSRCASRDGNFPVLTNNNLSFRIVCEVPRTLA